MGRDTATEDNLGLLVKDNPLVGGKHLVGKRVKLLHELQQLRAFQPLQLVDI